MSPRWGYGVNGQDETMGRTGKTEIRVRCVVFRSTPEKTEKTERLEVHAMGALWSIYKLILSYMSYSYMYPWECMYLQTGKIIRRLWGTTSTITRNRT